ncbi:MAG: cytidyltransferase-related domain [Rhodospirillales bacterium]|nr:cytidyltransferase-related domain [Rhodospirillales bacterium]
MKAPTKAGAHGDFRRKIITSDALARLIGARPREHSVIMCHGTFDLVHPGHIRHLVYAKSKADVLVASLTSDEHILKAQNRPYVPEDLRAMNLAALEVVDYVIVDPDPTPLRNLQRLQPDYFAKGYEYTAGGLHPRTREEIAVIEGYGGEIIFTPADVVYSSSAIIEAEPPDIAVEKLLALLEAESLTFADLYKTLDRVKGLKVHVVGDTIVDSYTQCVPIGSSTKTPTLSVRFEHQTDFVGGAAIVAKHLKAAGAEVSFSTILGDDRWHDFVLQDLAAAGVDCHAVTEPKRPTTNKAVIVANGYHLLKIDTLDNRPISEKTRLDLEKHIASRNGDIVVFSDFRHGIFNKSTIPSLAAAIPPGAFKVADSQVATRWGNILEFPAFDLITPNEREARFALAEQELPVRPLALELFKRAGCGTLILKLGARGALTYRSLVGVPEGNVRAFFVLDSFADRIVDAVGSGDALLAYASLALKATGSEVIATALGSIAAAVECGREGNIPVTVDDVRETLAHIEKTANYG